jgi:hypothetical protein
MVTTEYECVEELVAVAGNHLSSVVSSISKTSSWRSTRGGHRPHSLVVGSPMVLFLDPHDSIVQSSSALKTHGAFH